MKRNEIIEGLKDPKDNPCWKGYKPVGTKKKNGKTVPNCVPKESVQEEKQKGVDGKACWDGYKRMGTKKKGSKTVDNCVKVGEDWHPNDTPPGPETKPTMPAGTVKVDVSDVYDWYKLGKNIPNLKAANKQEFGKGPPSTIVSFGDEETEHKYIKDLQKLGLTTTDIDPVDPKQPRGMKRQKVDPTYNVNERESNDDPLKNREDYAKMNKQGQVYKKTYPGDKVGMTKAYAYDIKRTGPKGKLPKEGIEEMYGRKSNYYNPMDYERDQQRQMDWEKRDFKRREMEHELGHEDDPNFERNFRQQQIDRDRGPWYLKVNGKILKSKGEVKVFDWKRGANNYAMAILKNRPELQGKIFLTKKMQDDSTDVAESKTTVKVPVSQKPRQGPLRPQTGGGAHRDKKKEQKQGKEKHKKPMYEQDYTADEMVDILSGKKTQAQVDAEKKSKAQTAPQTPKPTTPTPPKPAKEAAGELKVQKDDDNATILLNPTTGVQTQIDKKNPNAPKITQDETGKLKLQMPGSAQTGGTEPKIVGKDVEVATPPMEDVANILKLAGL